MTWHIEPRVLKAYARHSIDDSLAYSVEAHLLACQGCRAQISEVADRRRLEAMWVEIDNLVALPEPGLIEKLLLRVGVRDHVARLLAATPSLRLSWLCAVTLALAFAVVAAHYNEQGFLLFLIVAPLLPLAGVAVAYGPGVDPTYEIGLASPMRGFHLLSIRTIAVLTSTTVLASIAALMLPNLNWAMVAWLLPSLGLTSAGLALATMFKPLKAASGVAVVWVAGSAAGVTFAARSAATTEDVFGDLMQVVLLIVLLASSTLLVHRRESFERGVRP